MAWYNNLGDLVGDVGQIAQGKNPANKPPVKNIPAGGIGPLPMTPSPPSSGQTALPDDPINNGDNGDGEFNPADPTSGTSGGGSSILGELGSAIAAGGSALASFLSQHGTQVLEAVQIADAAYRQTQANTYSNDALKAGQASYDSKAGLRTAGVAGMLNPGANTPNLSNIKALSTTGSGNPFANALPMAGAAAPFHGAPSGALPIATGTTNPAVQAGTGGTGNPALPAGTIANLPPGATAGLPAALAGAGMPPGTGAQPPGTIANLPPGATAGLPAAISSAFGTPPATPPGTPPGIKPLPLAGGISSVPTTATDPSNPLNVNRLALPLAS